MENFHLFFKFSFNVFWTQSYTRTNRIDNLNIEKTFFLQLKIFYVHFGNSFRNLINFNGASRPVLETTFAGNRCYSSFPFVVVLNRIS